MQFNIGSYVTHSVLDTPDLWANIVLYVTVEFLFKRIIKFHARRQI